MSFPIPESFFHKFILWLAASTYEASVLIIFLVLIQFFPGRRFTAKWRYCLWLILLLRLIIPINPESALSIFSIVPHSFRNVFITDYSNGRNSNHIDDIVPSSFYGSENTGEKNIRISQTVSENNNTPIDLTAGDFIPEAPSDRSLDKYLQPNKSFLALFIIWSTGAVIMILLTAHQALRFLLSVRNRRFLTDHKALEILEDCKEEMGIHAYLAIVETPYIKSPSLYGFIRPKLLLPAGSIEKMGYERLKYIFKHELAHLKRRDIVINWLLTFLQIIHWFNPLIWIAFAGIKAEREILCDLEVLSSSKNDASQEYGKTIIYLLENYAKPYSLPGLACILEEKEFIKRRITMIAKFPNQNNKMSILGFLLLVLFACSALTDSKSNVKITNNKAETAASLIDISATSFEIASYQSDKKDSGMFTAGIAISNDLDETTPPFSVHFFRLEKNGYFSLINNAVNTGGPIKPKDIFREMSLPFSLDTEGNIIFAALDINNAIHEKNEANNICAGNAIVKDNVIIKWDESLNISDFHIPSDWAKACGINDEDSLQLITNKSADPKELLGEWKTVDFVEVIKDFSPETKKWKGEKFVVDSLKFFDDGKTSGPWTWGDGYLYHPGDKSISLYTIKNINGKKYFFMQWMSGDVLKDGKKPLYYVFEKI